MQKPSIKVSDHYIGTLEIQVIHLFKNIHEFLVNLARNSI